MPTVEFKVRGKIIAATTKSMRVNEWRSALGETALYERNKLQYTQPTKDTIFDVRIKFYLDKRSLLKCDLDNLAKPVLDTIFCSLKSPHKNSRLENTLFDCGDQGVRKLSLEKYAAESDVGYGADIRVTW